MIMSLLIVGPTGPKHNIDVYFAATNRGFEYVVGFRDIKLGCVHEIILLDARKSYVDDQ